MSLTWKDLVTTVLAVSVFGLYVAVGRGFNLPIISGYRGAILAVGILGMLMCAFSNGNSGTWANPFIAVASVLGIAAIMLIIYGLITGTKLAFVLLTLIILVLWVLSTLRHFVAG